MMIMVMMIKMVTVLVMEHTWYLVKSCGVNTAVIKCDPASRTEPSGMS